MSAYQSDYEAAVLQAILPNLEAQGFEVFLHPSRVLLPPFMHGHQPDAIAIKADKKLAIEVISNGEHQEARLHKLRELLAGHQDWEMRIIYAPPREGSAEIQPMPKALLEQTLAKLGDIFDQSGAVAALLTAWSVLEAVAKRGLPHHFKRPRTPEALVETLAETGLLLPDDADEARKFSELRTLAAHGQLDIAIGQREFESFVELIRQLLQTVE